MKETISVSLSVYKPKYNILLLFNETEMIFSNKNEWHVQNVAHERKKKVYLRMEMLLFFVVVASHYTNLVCAKVLILVLILYLQLGRTKTVPSRKVFHVIWQWFASFWSANVYCVFELSCYTKIRPRVARGICSKPGGQNNLFFFFFAAVM